MRQKPAMVTLFYGNSTGSSLMEKVKYTLSIEVDPGL